MLGVAPAPTRNNPPSRLARSASRQFRLHPHDTQRVAVHYAPGVSQHQPPRPALQKGRAERLLQIPDLHAHGRLAERQGIGSSGEAAGVHDFGEGAKLVECPCRLHNRILWQQKEYFA